MEIVDVAPYLSLATLVYIAHLHAKIAHMAAEIRSLKDHVLLARKEAADQAGRVHSTVCEIKKSVSDLAAIQDLARD